MQHQYLQFVHMNSYFLCYYKYQNIYRLIPFDHCTQNYMQKYNELQQKNKQEQKGENNPDQSSISNERKDKNQRQLWQILQKQLSMSQDQLQYEQWIDSLIIHSDISIKSTNIRIYKYRQICYKITIILLLYEILNFKWYLLNPFSVSLDFKINISELLSISSILNASLSATYSIISLVFSFFNPLSFLLFIDFYSLFKSMLGHLIVTLFKIFRVLLLLYLIYRSLQLKKVINRQEKIKDFERIRDSIASTLLLIAFNFVISNLIKYLLLPHVIIVIISYFIFLTQKKSNSLDILSLIIFFHQGNYHHDMNFSEYLYPFLQSSLTLLIITHTKFTFSQNINHNVYYYITLHIMYLIFSQQFYILFLFLIVMVLLKFIEFTDQKFERFKSNSILKSRKQEINMRYNQIKYKDYRKYWDITLPIEQYH